LSRHEHGDSNQTGGKVAASVLERKAIAAIVNAGVHVIALASYHFVIAVWRAKTAECAA